MKHLLTILLTLFFLTMSAAQVEPVRVTFSGTKAQVKIPSALKKSVKATVSGADVRIEQVGTTASDVVYALAGTAANGSFALEGRVPITLQLDGLTLTSERGAAITIDCVPSTHIVLTAGTQSALTDGATVTKKTEGTKHNACLMLTGDVRFSGQGTLSVNGRAKHALWSKGGVSVDAQCGAITLVAAGGDGISAKTGFQQCGGQLVVEASADASKGISTGGVLSIEGGVLQVTTTGGGTFNEKKDKTKASACLDCDSIVRISGGQLTLVATGDGGKGISADADVEIQGGNIQITTSGQQYRHTATTQTSDATTAPADSTRRSFGFGGFGGFGGFPFGPFGGGNSNYSSSPKGIKADGNVLISGGQISVTTTGEGGEGIESKKELTITGGDIVVESYDDAINSASHMYIRGGRIFVNAQRNDGLDSNGNMYIEGGLVVAYGTDMPECGIDAAEEEGYSVIVTGGTLVGIGGGTSLPNARLSTQPCIVFTDSLPMGSTLAITAQDGTPVLAFTHQRSYGGFRFGPMGGGPGGPMGEGEGGERPAFPGFPGFDGELPEGFQMPDFGNFPRPEGDSIVRPGGGFGGPGGPMGGPFGRRDGEEGDADGEGFGGPMGGPGGFGGGPQMISSGKNGTILITSPDLKAGSSYTLSIDAEASADAWHGLTPQPTLVKAGTKVGEVSNLALPYSQFSGADAAAE